MKSKNLITTLAIIAVSAVPLMAHEFDDYNLDKELRQEVKVSVKQELNTQMEQQKSPHPYHDFVLAYIEFDNLIKDISLSDQRKNKVCKKLFTIINDMAKAILDMEEEHQPGYKDSVTIALQERPFVYKNETATTWEELFNFAIQNKSIHYDNNTPIVKFLQIPVPNTDEENDSSWWQGLIETFQHEK